MGGTGKLVILLCEELEAKGFNVAREERFLTPDSASGKAYRDVDVFGHTASIRTVG